jgi:CheY-like chemotaxis protein
MPAFAKVLFIDDDMISTNINERLLLFSGFTTDIIVKRDGHQAKEFLLNHHRELPEIIFVDLYMPGIGGFEFLDWFNKWCRKENIYIPLYVLSCSMSKHDFDQAYTYKINGYIVKPITSENLNEIVRQQHPEKSHQILNFSDGKQPLDRSSTIAK